MLYLMRRWLSVFQTKASVVLQAQVLAMMGQTKEAEKMTNHIVSEEAGCLECYRLLSAIYSKQENHDKVEHAGVVWIHG